MSDVLYTYEGFLGQCFPSNPLLIPSGPTNALGWLSGETQGFAIDATTYDTVTGALYTGGPVGGTVAVIDTGTPANNLSNVPINSSNLTNGGTSGKLVQWNDGFLRWSPHNVLPYSEVFGSWPNNSNVSISSNSTVAPDGNTTADSVTNTGSFGAVANSAFALMISYYYCWSIYIRKTSGASLFPGITLIGATEYGLTINTDTGVVTGRTAKLPITSGSFDAGNYWRVYLGGIATALNNFAIYPNVNSDGSGNWVGGVSQNTIIIWGSQVNRGLTPSLYIATPSTTPTSGVAQEYDSATNKFYIPIEPAVTNYIKSSNVFSGWTTDQASAVGNSVNDPIGITEASTLTDTAANQRHIIYTTLTGLPAGSNTVSVYAKNNNQRYIYLSLFSGIIYGIVVDLTNGTVTDVHSEGSPTGTSNSVLSVGNGWYRLRVTSSTAGGGLIVIGLSNSATPTYSGGAPAYIGSGNSVYLFGAQAELGVVATSWIGTGTSTVTRSADDISALLSTIPTFTSLSSYYQAMFQESGSSNSYFVGIDDASAANQAVQYNAGASQGALTFDVNNASAVQAHMTGLGNTPLTVFKGGWRAAANNFNQALNGAADTADVSGTMPTSPTKFRLGGQGVAAAQQGRSKLYYVVSLPRALSDSELVAKTT